MYIGFWKRFGAYLIDYVILSAGTIIFFIIWAVIGGLLSTLMSAMDKGEDIISTIIGVVGIVMLFSISWLYSAIFESSKLGATLGKLAIGSVVVDNNGDRITFLRASIRYWCKIISMVPLFLGFMMVGYTQKKQALHDVISDTYVIKKNTKQIIQ